MIRNKSFRLALGFALSVLGILLIVAISIVPMKLGKGDSGNDDRAGHPRHEECQGGPVDRDPPRALPG